MNPIAQVMTPVPDSTVVCLFGQIFGQTIMGGISNSGAAGQSCVTYGNPAMLSALSAGFSASMGIYVAACYALVGFVTSWYWIVAIMTGATTGQATHQAINPIWGPVRIALSGIMLAPVAGGFCTLQVILLWLFTQGSGIADHVWIAAVQKMSNPPGTQIPAQNLPGILSLERSVLEMEVCRAVINTTYSGVQNGGYVVHSRVQASSGGQGGDNELEYNIVDQSGNVVVPGGCGILTYTTPTAVGGGGAQGAFGQNLQSLVGQVQNAHIAALQQLIQTIRPVVGQLVILTLNTAASTNAQNHQIPLTAADIQNEISQASQNMQSFFTNNRGVLANAALAYSNSINSAYGQASGAGAVNMGEILSNAQNKGWFWAGDFYKELSTTLRTLQLVANQVPQATESPMAAWSAYSDQLPSVLRNDLVIATNDANHYMDHYGLKMGLQQSFGPANGMVAGSGGTGTAVTVLSDLEHGQGSKALLDMIMDTLTVDSSGNVNDALQMSMSLGNLLQVTGEGILAFKGVAGVAGALGAGGKVLSVVGKVDGFVRGLTGGKKGGGLAGLGWTLLGAGLVLNTLVPALPGLVWLFFTIWWLILVVEFMIAAPLWAVGHAIPEGPGFAGQYGRQGYIKTLDLMLYPTLGVFGLIMSMVVMEIATGLALQSLRVAVQWEAQADVFGLFNTVGLIVIYSLVMITVMYLSIQLITRLPQTVTRILGGGIEGGREFDSVKQTVAPHGVGARITDISGKGGSVEAIGGAIGEGMDKASKSMGVNKLLSFKNSADAGVEGPNPEAQTQGMKGDMGVELHIKED